MITAIKNNLYEWYYRQTNFLVLIIPQSRGVTGFSDNGWMMIQIHIRIYRSIIRWIRLSHCQVWEEELAT